MEYKRLTDSKTAQSMKKYGKLINPYYVRLAELEDKIEQGTLKELPENMVVLTREEYEKHKGFSREEVDEIVETAKKNLRKKITNKN